MIQRKRISAGVSSDALVAIWELGVAARLARSEAGIGQTTAAALVGVPVQTTGRIEAGQPGVAIGHVLGMLSQSGIRVRLQLSGDL